MKSLVPPIASITNPIDLTPETYNQPNWLALFPRALDVIAADPNIHTLLFQVGATAHRAKEIMDNICDLRRRTDKTICVAWTLAPRNVLERLPAEGFYPFPEHARASRVIGQLVRYGAALSRPPRPNRVEVPDFNWAAYVAKPRPGLVISEHECHRILTAAGLPVAPGQLATSSLEAAQAADAVGYPVALKGISPAVTHRAAAGLLALDLRSDREVSDAYDRLMDRARDLEIELEGVYVQRMVRGSLELLVSAFRDPQFGVMVSCGAGGNLTELIDDITLERAPVDQALALHMLGRLRIMQHAPRLERGIDPRTVAEFVAHFSRLALTAPWRRFVLEVNPIKWSGDRVVAVDGLLIVEDP